MTTLLIVLALIWPAFWLIRVLLVTKALVGFEFRRARVTIHPPGAVPAHIREAAQAWTRQLQALEFQPAGGWRLGCAADPVLDEEAVVLLHATHPIRAIVQPRDEANLSGECWLSLRTTLLDGTEIATNTHAPEAFLPLCADVNVELVSTVFARELFERHLARITPVIASTWPCTDPASAATRETHIRNALLNDAVALGLLVARGENGYSLRPGAAFKQALAILRVAAKNKKLQKGATVVPNATPLSPESLAAFDLHHYRQMVAFSRGRLSLRTKAVISSVSFLLFAAVLAWQYSLVVAVTLIIALIIHEGGHLLGMRLFGYRDTQLLFIPFFGGAAVGHDDKVLKPWQHIVIVLLGPLPGIFLALGMFVYISGGHAPEWVTQVAITTLILNVFNLLPVMPLDGGQIVDLAVASRFPRARVLFLAVSAAGMALLGLAGGGARVLLYLGIASLLRLPVEWRSAGVRRAVREEFPDGGEEEPIVQRLLEHVREPEWAKTPVPQRLQLVRGLQLALRMPRAGIGTICFALAAVTSPIWLGTPLVLWAVVRGGEAQVSQALARAEAAGITAAPPAPAVLPAGLAPADNAALDYAQAAQLARAQHAAAGEPEDAGEETPPDTDVITLLRAAAQKRAFVPEPAAAPSGKAGAGLSLWGHGQLVTQLTQAADERVRYHEPLEAIALDVDALRLLQLMQSSPGYLDWSTYNYMANACWNNVEEALATGTAPPPALIGELRHLSADQPVIDFAVASIPAGMMEHPTGLDELGEDEAEAATAAIGWLTFLQKMNPFWTQARVEAIDQAVVAQAQLQEIQHGTWPAVELKEDDPKQALTQVAQLADLLARQRQMRTALRITELHQRGTKDVKLESLGTSPAELKHPLTGEQMRLVRRGSLDVLAFHPSSNLVWGLPNSAQNEVRWRVPVPAK
jgi:Zn-dependent protease